LIRYRVIGRLLDDHHGAVGMLGDAVGGGAEEVVAQEVTLVAEDDQVGVGLVGDADDQLGCVAGVELDVELDAGRFGLPAGVGEQPLEEGVLLAFHFVDFADGGGVGGQRAFDGERGSAAPAREASSSAFVKARSEASEPSMAARIFSNGI
jgi:hypothetical protein